MLQRANFIRARLGKSPPGAVRFCALALLAAAAAVLQANSAPTSARLQFLAPKAAYAQAVSPSASAVTVTFSQVPANSGGMISAGNVASGQAVAAGGTVTFTATPTAEYYVAGWSDARCAGSFSPRQIGPSNAKTCALPALPPTLDLTVTFAAGPDLLLSEEWGATGIADLARLRTLLQDGANPDATTDGGEPYLIAATNLTLAGAATILLEFGANPNIEDDENFRPMERLRAPYDAASSSSQFEILALSDLLTANGGRCKLSRPAAWRYHETCVGTIGVQHGRTLARSVDQTLAPDEASLRSQVAFLADNSADFDFVGLPDRGNAAALAALHGHAVALSIMLAAGFNPDARDIQGKAPLHFIAEYQEAPAEQLNFLRHFLGGMAAAGKAQIFQGWNAASAAGSPLEILRNQRGGQADDDVLEIGRLLYERGARCAGSDGALCRPAIVSLEVPALHPASAGDLLTLTARDAYGAVFTFALPDATTRAELESSGWLAEVRNLNDNGPQEFALARARAGRDGDRPAMLTVAMRGPHPVFPERMALATEFRISADILISISRGVAAESVGAGDISVFNSAGMELSEGDSVFQGERVRFIATPRIGHHVSEWSGACAEAPVGADGGGRECMVRAGSADLKVTVVFSPGRLQPGVSHFGGTPGNAAVCAALGGTDISVGCENAFPNFNLENNRCVYGLTAAVAPRCADLFAHARDCNIRNRPALSGDCSGLFCTELSCGAPCASGTIARAGECIPVGDQCVLENVSCHRLASCADPNLISYENAEALCACDSGYAGDGLHCGSAMKSAELWTLMTMSGDIRASVLQLLADDADPNHNPGDNHILAHAVGAAQAAAVSILITAGANPAGRAAGRNAVHQVAANAAANPAKHLLVLRHFLSALNEVGKPDSFAGWNESASGLPGGGFPLGVLNATLATEEAESSALEIVRLFYERGARCMDGAGGTEEGAHCRIPTEQFAMTVSASFSGGLYTMTIGEDYGAGLEITPPSPRLLTALSDSGWTLAMDGKAPPGFVFGRARNGADGDGAAVFTLTTRNPALATGDQAVREFRVNARILVDAQRRVDFVSDGAGTLTALNGEVTLQSGDAVRQNDSLRFIAVPAAGHYVSLWTGPCADAPAGANGGARECAFAADNADILVSVFFHPGRLAASVPLKGILEGDAACAAFGGTAENASIGGAQARICRGATDGAVGDYCVYQAANGLQKCADLFSHNRDCNIQNRPAVFAGCGRGPDGRYCAELSCGESCGAGTLARGSRCDPLDQCNPPPSSSAPNPCHADAVCEDANPHSSDAPAAICTCPPGLAGDGAVCRSPATSALLLAEVSRPHGTNILAAVLQLLEDDADPNAEVDQYNTALGLAGYNGHADAVSVLIHAGADILGRGRGRDIPRNAGRNATNPGAPHDFVRVLRAYVLALSETGQSYPWTAPFTGEQDHAGRPLPLLQSNSGPGEAEEIWRLMYERGARCDANRQPPLYSTDKCLTPAEERVAQTTRNFIGEVLTLTARDGLGATLEIAPPDSAQAAELQAQGWRLETRNGPPQRMILSRVRASRPDDGQAIFTVTMTNPALPADRRAVGEFRIRAGDGVLSAYVDYAANGDGAMSVSSGGSMIQSGGVVSLGATVTFVAVPAAGHYVRSWTGECATISFATNGRRQECVVRADGHVRVSIRFHPGWLPEGVPYAGEVSDSFSHCESYGGRVVSLIGGAAACEGWEAPDCDYPQLSDDVWFMPSCASIVRRAYRECNLENRPSVVGNCVGGECDFSTFSCGDICPRGHAAAGTRCAPIVDECEARNPCGAFATCLDPDHVVLHSDEQLCACDAGADGDGIFCADPDQGAALADAVRRPALGENRASILREVRATVLQLLEEGASPNHRQGDDYVLPLAAARPGQHGHAVSILLTAGANPSARSDGLFVLQHIGRDADADADRALHVLRHFIGGLIVAGGLDEFNSDDGWNNGRPLELLRTRIVNNEDDPAAQEIFKIMYEMGARCAIGSEGKYCNLIPSETHSPPAVAASFIGDALTVTIRQAPGALFSLPLPPPEIQSMLGDSGWRLRQLAGAPARMALSRFRMALGVDAAAVVTVTMFNPALPVDEQAVREFRISAALESNFESLARIDYAASGDGVLSAHGDGRELQSGDRILSGAFVTVMASPLAGRHVSSWSGPCANAPTGVYDGRRECVFRATINSQVTAVFQTGRLLEDVPLTGALGGRTHCLSFGGIHSADLGGLSAVAPGCVGATNGTAGSQSGHINSCAYSGDGEGVPACAVLFEKNRECNLQNRPGRFGQCAGGACGVVACGEPCADGLLAQGSKCILPAGNQCGPSGPCDANATCLDDDDPGPPDIAERICICNTGRDSGDGACAHDRDAALLREVQRPADERVGARVLNALNAGANPNYNPGGHQHVLGVAARNRHAAAVRALLEAGADPAGRGGAGDRSVAHNIADLVNEDPPGHLKVLRRFISGMHVANSRADFHLEWNNAQSDLPEARRPLNTLNDSVNNENPAEHAAEKMEICALFYEHGARCNRDRDDACCKMPTETLALTLSQNGTLTVDASARDALGPVFEMPPPGASRLAELSSSGWMLATLSGRPRGVVLSRARVSQPFDAAVFTITMMNVFAATVSPPDSPPDPNLGPAREFRLSINYSANQCDANPCAVAATCEDPDLSVFNAPELICACPAGFFGSGVECESDKSAELHLEVRRNGDTRTSILALLRDGANPNYDPENLSPVIIAAATAPDPGNAREALRILITAGANPKTRDASGRGVAHVLAAAAGNGHPEGALAAMRGFLDGLDQTGQVDSFSDEWNRGAGGWPPLNGLALAPSDAAETMAALTYQRGGRCEVGNDSHFYCAPPVRTFDVAPSHDAVGAVAIGVAEDNHGSVFDFEMEDAAAKSAELRRSGWNVAIDGSRRPHQAAVFRVRPWRLGDSQTVQFTINSFNPSLPASLQRTGEHRIEARIVPNGRLLEILYGPESPEVRASVRALLNLGASPNYDRGDHRHVAGVAARHLHPQALSVLLTAGADPAGRGGGNRNIAHNLGVHANSNPPEQLEVLRHFLAGMHLASSREMFQAEWNSVDTDLNGRPRPLNALNDSIRTGGANHAAEKAEMCALFYEHGARCNRDGNDACCQIPTTEVAAGLALGALLTVDSQARESSGASFEMPPPSDAKLSELSSSGWSLATLSGRPQGVVLSRARANQPGDAAAVFTITMRNGLAAEFDSALGAAREFHVSVAYSANQCDANPCDANAICMDPNADSSDPVESICTCSAGFFGNGVECESDKSAELHALVSQNNDNRASVLSLLADGADPNHNPAVGGPVLIMAAVMPSAPNPYRGEVVSVLVAAGADPAAVSDDPDNGRGVLHLLVRYAGGTASQSEGALDALRNFIGALRETGRLESFNEWNKRNDDLWVPLNGLGLYRERPVKLEMARMLYENGARCDIGDGRNDDYCEAPRAEFSGAVEDWPGPGLTVAALDSFGDVLDLIPPEDETKARLTASGWELSPAASNLRRRLVVSRVRPWLPGDLATVRFTVLAENPALPQGDRTAQQLGVEIVLGGQCPGACAPDAMCVDPDFFHNDPPEALCSCESGEGDGIKFCGADGRAAYEAAKTAQLRLQAGRPPGDDIRDAVLTLLGEGADANFNSGEILALAASNLHAEAVGILMAAGANLNGDFNRQNVLQHVASHADQNAAEALKVLRHFIVAARGVDGLRDYGGFNASPHPLDIVAQKIPIANERETALEIHRVLYEHGARCGGRANGGSGEYCETPAETRTKILESSIVGAVLTLEARDDSMETNFEMPPPDGSVLSELSRSGWLLERRTNFRQAVTLSRTRAYRAGDGPAFFTVTMMNQNAQTHAAAREFRVSLGYSGDQCLPNPCAPGAVCVDPNLARGDALAGLCECAYGLVGDGASGCAARGVNGELFYQVGRPLWADIRSTVLQLLEDGASANHFGAGGFHVLPRAASPPGYHAAAVSVLLTAGAHPNSISDGLAVLHIVGKNLAGAPRQMLTVLQKFIAGLDAAGRRKTFTGWNALGDGKSPLDLASVHAKGMLTQAPLEDLSTAALVDEIFFPRPLDGGRNRWCGAIGGEYSEVGRGAFTEMRCVAAGAHVCSQLYSADPAHYAQTGKPPCSELLPICAEGADPDGNPFTPDCRKARLTRRTQDAAREIHALLYERGARCGAGGEGDFCRIPVEEKSATVHATDLREVMRITDRDFAGWDFNLTPDAKAMKNLARVGITLRMENSPTGPDSLALERTRPWTESGPAFLLFTVVMRTADGLVDGREFRVSLRLLAPPLIHDFRAAGEPNGASVRFAWNATFSGANPRIRIQPFSGTRPPATNPPDCVGVYDSSQHQSASQYDQAAYVDLSSSDAGMEFASASATVSISHPVAVGQCEPFHLIAEDAHGRSDVFSVFYIQGIPNAPRNFQVSVSGDGFLLEWDAPDELRGAAARGYSALRSLGENEFVPVAYVPFGAALQHMDIPPPGTSIRYRIALESSAGRVYSNVREVRSSGPFASAADFYTMSLVALAKRPYDSESEDDLTRSAELFVSHFNADPNARDGDSDVAAVAAVGGHAGMVSVLLANGASPTSQKNGRMIPHWAADGAADSSPTLRARWANVLRRFIAGLHRSGESFNWNALSGAPLMRPLDLAATPSTDASTMEIRALIYERGGRCAAGTDSIPTCGVPMEARVLQIPSSRLGPALTIAARDFAGERFYLELPGSANNLRLLAAGWRLRLRESSSDETERLILDRTQDLPSSSTFTITMRRRADGAAARKFAIRAEALDAPPNPPTTLRALLAGVDPPTIALEWENPTAREDGILDYAFWRASTAPPLDGSGCAGLSEADFGDWRSGGPTFIEVGNVSAGRTSAVAEVKGLEYGRCHIVAAAARNIVGRGAQAVGESFHAHAPPLAPQEFSAVADSGGTVALSWRAVSDAAARGSDVFGYSIWRTYSGAEHFLSLAFTAQTTYMDSGLSPGVTVAYKIRARNDAGPGAASATVITTPGSPNQAALDNAMSAVVRIRPDQNPLEYANVGDDARRLLLQGANPRAPGLLSWAGFTYHPEAVYHLLEAGADPYDDAGPSGLYAPRQLAMALVNDDRGIASRIPALRQFILGLQVRGIRDFDWNRGGAPGRAMNDLLSKTNDPAARAMADLMWERGARCLGASSHPFCNVPAETLRPTALFSRLGALATITARDFGEDAFTLALPDSGKLSELQSSGWTLRLENPKGLPQRIILLRVASAGLADVQFTVAMRPQGSDWAARYFEVRTRLHGPRPSAPENLRAALVGANRLTISLSWNSPTVGAGLLAHRFWRGVASSPNGPDCSMANFGTWNQGPPSDLPEFLNVNDGRTSLLSPLAASDYGRCAVVAVAAENGAGPSAQTDGVRVYVAAPPVAPPDFSAVLFSSGDEVLLSWGALTDRQTQTRGANIQGWSILREMNGSGFFRRLTLADANAFSHNDAELPLGATLRYRIRAESDQGAGATAESEAIAVAVSEEHNQAALNASLIAAVGGEHDPQDYDPARDAAALAEVRRLLRAGADPNATSGEHHAMALAGWNGLPGAMRELILGGADIFAMTRGRDIPRNAGRNASDAVFPHGFDEVLRAYVLALHETGKSYPWDDPFRNVHDHANRPLPLLTEHSIRSDAPNVLDLWGLMYERGARCDTTLPNYRWARCRVPIDERDADVLSSQVGDVLTLTARDFAGAIFEMRLPDAGKLAELRADRWDVRVESPPDGPQRVVVSRTAEAAPDDAPLVVLTVTMLAQDGEEVRRFHVNLNLHGFIGPAENFRVEVESLERMRLFWNHPPQHDLVRYYQIWRVVKPAPNPPDCSHVVPGDFAFAETNEDGGWSPYNRDETFVLPFPSADYGKCAGYWLAARNEIEHQFAPAMTRIYLRSPPAAPRVTLRRSPDLATVFLSWNALTVLQTETRGASVRAYAVSREVNDSGGFVPLAAVAGTVFMDSTLPPGSVARYRVRAESDAGPGAFFETPMIHGPAGDGPSRAALDQYLLREVALRHNPSRDAESAAAVRDLLLAGANPNAVDGENTALGLAGYNGHAGAVSVLIHAGADLRAVAYGRDIPQNAGRNAAAPGFPHDFVRVLRAYVLALNETGQAYPWTAPFLGPIDHERRPLPLLQRNSDPGEADEIWRLMYERGARCDANRPGYDSGKCMIPFEQRDARVMESFIGDVMTLAAADFAGAVFEMRPPDSGKLAELENANWKLRAEGGVADPARLVLSRLAASVDDANAVFTVTMRSADSEGREDVRLIHVSVALLAPPPDAPTNLRVSLTVLDPPSAFLEDHPFLEGQSFAVLTWDKSANHRPSGRLSAYTYWRASARPAVAGDCAAANFGEWNPSAQGAVFHTLVVDYAEKLSAGFHLLGSDPFGLCYVYAVAAQGESGVGAWSARVTLHAAAPPVAPAAPAAHASPEGGAVVSWPPVLGRYHRRAARLDGYSVLRETGDDSVVVGFTSQTVFADRNAPDGVLARYRVRAESSAGPGAFSSPSPALRISESTSGLFHRVSHAHSVGGTLTASDAPADGNDIPAGGRIADGATVYFKAVPDAGYYLFGWFGLPESARCDSGESVTVAADCAFSVGGDLQVTVTFAAIESERPDCARDSNRAAPEDGSSCGECLPGHGDLGGRCVSLTEDLDENRETCETILRGDYDAVLDSQGAVLGEVCSGVDVNDTFCFLGSREALPCLGLFRHVRDCNLRHNRPALDPWHCGRQCAPPKRAAGAECVSPPE